MKKPTEDPCFSRRGLLKAASGFAGATLLGGMPFRAFAATAALAPSDRCFVFVYFGGGWDQLLALDPRDPTVFTPDRLSETRILPAYDLLNDPGFSARPVVPPTRSGSPASNITFGPAIGKLANHYDLMSVVRGVNMTTLQHEEGYRYFLTGKRPVGAAARGSSTATEIVGQMSPSTPLPSIAYGIESYNSRYPGSANALRVSRAADLLLTLSPSTRQLDSEIEKQLVDWSGKPVTCEAAAYGARGLDANYEASRAQMKQVLSSRLDNSFRFERPEHEALRAFYGLGATGPYDSAAGRVALVSSALKQGISQCVSLSLVGGLDTHFGTPLVHAQRLREGFDALGLLVEDLRQTPHPSGGHFMDHTTVLVFSEFARTPMLNVSNGRDHHLTSSCALIGAGIKHNFVYGYSSDLQMATGLIDLKTGLPAPNGSNVFPEHIIATVLASAGLDYSDTRSYPLPALLAG